MKFRYMNNNKGFTLVELVVILVIIAILAAITVPSLAGYIGDARERSHLKETEAIASAAETAVTKAYKLGKNIDEINGIGTPDDNLRKKILSMTGSSGIIVDFHVSDGANVDSDMANPVPGAFDFTPAGTLEFLEYMDNSGNWIGQYRLLEDGTPEVRILDGPEIGGGDVSNP